MSERENITSDELDTLREIGAAWIEANKERIEKAIKEGVLTEVSYDNKK